MKIVDLSQTIETSMPVYPGTLPPELKTANSLVNDGFNEMLITFYTHTGTHIDCPAHLFDNSETTDSFNISRFFGTACVIDCTGLNNREKITISEINSQLREVKGCDFVLFYTGWDKRWGKNSYFSDFPVISGEVAKYLSEGKIKGVGLDTISLDKENSTDLPLHNLVLKQNIIIIENLTNLEKLIGLNFYFGCFPLKIKGGDGSPVRAFALIY